MLKYYNFRFPQHHLSKKTEQMQVCRTNYLSPIFTNSSLFIKIKHVTLQI